MITAPYGSWESPITVDMMTSASVGLSTPTVDGPDLYWLESRADQRGRASLWRETDGVRAELTPEPFYVRTRVHEYGGGEYAARSRVVVFSHFLDGRLYVIRDQQDPRAITPQADLRYADLRVHPDQNVILAVREDHRLPGDAVNTIVELDLDGPNDDGGRVLCAGADFFSTPELFQDRLLGQTRLAWTQWDHPNMPWDSTLIKVARLEGSQIGAVQDIAGGEGESAIQPRWTSRGELIFVSDRSNWWNLYAWSEDSGVRALHPAEAEFAGPQWRLGQNPYAVIDDDHLLCTWTRNGAAAIGRLTVSSGELTCVAKPGVGTGSLSVDGHRAAAVLSCEEQPMRLATLDLTEGAWSQKVWSDVRRASEIVVDSAMMSVAEPVSWSSDLGPVFGWFYPPTNRSFAAPDGALAPLITSSHGGPTAFSAAVFSLGVQYWTSRGFAVLDVNYGGSTGYGRAYRDRLRGNWGIVDVADCAAGASAMGEQGRADPGRLAIEGGSAGGYTTLRALTVTDVFTAGISLYGVGDLEALAKDTHKFESRYLDGLVGPYPEALELYQDRSPINHVDKLTAPILLLQGADDMVVPLNQAETMAAAARSKGLPVALIIFPGEGHGFRGSENIKASIEAQLYFLGRVFGFTPADELPKIPIDNLADLDPI